MIFAAGILIVTKTGEVLFLKRGSGSDYPGQWCFPGGRLEDGEDAAAAAVRETKEETGYDIDPKSLTTWTRRIAPPLGEGGEPVDFTTFVAKIDAAFVPDIQASGEHTAWQWSSITEQPAPLHPGCAIALARFGMDELGIARAMAAGELTSPQTYNNISLFDVRISGTGYAQRAEQLDDKGKVKHEAEVTYRRPENYLTQDFLDRCNGLPVILLHPDRPVMNTEDFSSRVIGMIFLPYIKGDEVWGIAKIYNADAAKVLATKQLSTSPGVLLGKDDHHLRLEDGSKFLIEGNPRLVDHLAICPQGVWDKGGDPVGVSTTGELDMKVNLKRLDNESDAQYTARCDEAAAIVASARHDAAGGGDAAKLFAALEKKIDDANSRLDAAAAARKDDDEKREKDEKERNDKSRKDAMERCDAFKFSKKDTAEDDKSYKDRHDAEEGKLAKEMEEAGEPKDVAADKAKKRRHDAEKVETDERADAAAKKDKDMDDEGRSDAVKALTAKNVELEAALADIRKSIPKPLTDDDYTKFSGVQAKHDQVYSMHGKSAPRPQQGESIDAYRVRLLNGLKPATEWEKINLDLSRLDAAGLDLAETQILAQSATAARNPKVPPGTLIEVPGRTRAGHNKIEFMGEPISWMAANMPTGAFVTQYNVNPTKH